MIINMRPVLKMSNVPCRLKSSIERVSFGVISYLRKLTVAMATAAFDEMGVCAELVRVVAEHEWLVPTPVQTEVIPLLLGGGDVLAAAETGSGKTGAFLIPMLQVIQEALLRPTQSPQARVEEASTPMESVTWSERDRDAQLRIKDKGKCVMSDDTKRWLGARATTGVRDGTKKAYYECEVVHCGKGGVVRVGWSTVAASFDLGVDRHGFGYGGTGKKAHAKLFTPYGEPFSEGDVVGCFLDLELKCVRFAKNGVVFDDAFSLATTLTGSSTMFFPAVCVKNAEATARFGNEMGGFRYADQVKQLGYVGVAQLAVLSDALSSSSGGAARRLGIIIEPSRDLARQVFDCAVAFKKYMQHPSVRVSLCIGGDGNGRRSLQSSDLVIVTPGRLLDLVSQRAVELSRVELLILDEVDQLVATDAAPTIEKLHAMICQQRRSPPQVGFFSATLHASGVMPLADRLCRYPLLVDLKGKDFIPDTVQHMMLSVSTASALDQITQHRELLPATDGVHTVDTSVLLSRSLSDDKEHRSQLLKLAKPLTLIKVLERLRIEQCMIFCRTNLDCDLLEKFLNAVGRRQRDAGIENPLSCCVLAGMRSMASRQQALDSFRDGTVRLLLCTDVAARGIDVPQLCCVINLTLPDAVENYIHRVGRVGRNDHIGLAISIVAQDDEEKVWFHKNCPSHAKPRGVGCTNRKLLTKGGCTMWYNEPQLRREVGKRLGRGVETVANTEELERAIEQRGGMAQYGRERRTEGEAEERNELLKLRPHVQKLAVLEEKVQTGWFELQQRLQVV